MRTQSAMSYWWDKNTDPSDVNDGNLPPERRLLVALLQKSLDDLEPEERISIATRREAINWFTQPFADARFSFGYVALTLELPKEYIPLIIDKVAIARHFNMKQLRKREMDKIARRELKQKCRISMQGSIQVTRTVA